MSNDFPIKPESLVLDRDVLRLVLRTQSPPYLECGCAEDQPQRVGTPNHPGLSPHVLPLATCCDWCYAHSRPPYLECGCAEDQPQRVGTPNHPGLSPHALPLATCCDWCYAHSRPPYLECGCVEDQPQRVGTPNRPGLTPHALPLAPRSGQNKDWKESGSFEM